LELSFLIKKIVSAMIMPLNLGILIALIGLFFLYRDQIKKAKLFLTVGIIWLSIISYTPFSNFLLTPLETKYTKLESIPTNIKYIVYLGGDQQNRGWEVLRLYNNLHNAKIITSGYEGRALVPEAIKTANILNNIGINSKDIIIHPKPKDTKEEAIKIKKVLKEEKFILVTSAYHMPRAMKIFQDNQLNPIPAPADFMPKCYDNFGIFPNANMLLWTQKAIHEYVGIIWYDITKVIDGH